VLTKVDLIGDDARARARESVLDLGMPDPLLASTVTGEGLDELRQAILNQLHGSPRRLRLHPPTEEGDVTLAALIAELYERGLPVEHPGQENDGVEAVELECWIDAASLGRMQRAHPRQVESVSDGEQG
jgi:50S ribosomal subunit-associated GTPase HflX